jgi:RNA polymerase sigma-70 factor (ECF subfamily)
MNFERLPEVFKKYSPTEERQFMEQARAELSAFSPLYEAYCQRIYAYCLRRTGQPEEAEDLTSLVFTRALTGLNGYRGGSVAAWLFQIAHNAIANHLRDRPARLSFEALAGSLATGKLAEPGEKPLEIFLRKEQQARLRDLLERLSEEQRELLALSVAGELTARETGQILGKSEGAVRMQLRRLLQQLRLMYEQSEGVE